MLCLLWLGFPPVCLPVTNRCAQDWKYLGDGAWAPKGKAGRKAGGAAKKNGAGSKQRGGSTSVSASASPSGSRDSEDEHSGDEAEGLEEENETDAGDVEMAEAEAGALPAAAAGDNLERRRQQQQQQPTRPSVAPELPAVASRKRSAAEAKIGEASPVAVDVPIAGTSSAGEAAPPAQKKPRNRGTGRKRLDPIVREALRAAEKGERWCTIALAGCGDAWTARQRFACHPRVHCCPVPCACSVPTCCLT